METGRGAEGILSDEMASKREEIIGLLKQAYFAELETVINYVTNSTNPDGVRAQEIKEALEEDVQEELQHAQQFAARIKELYGVVPGSTDFKAEQTLLQPPEEQTDVVHVIKGVIDAETKAIELYQQIVDTTEEADPVTQDMVIDICATNRATAASSRAFPGSMRRRDWPSSYGNRPKEKRGPAVAAGPLFSALKTSYGLFDGRGAGEYLERLAEGVLLL